VDIFDVKILSTKSNNLKKESYIKIRQIKSISKKRIWWYIWKITDINIKDDVQNNLIKMFWMKI
jgi:mRNA-degrading endonuclease toxin of MazEF toxin-antitoxin module